MNCDFEFKKGHIVKCFLYAKSYCSLAVSSSQSPAHLPMLTRGEFCLQTGTVKLIIIDTWLEALNLQPVWLKWDS